MKIELIKEIKNNQIRYYITKDGKEVSNSEISGGVFDTDEEVLKAAKVMYDKVKNYFSTKKEDEITVILSENI